MTKKQKIVKDNRGQESSVSAVRLNPKRDCSPIWNQWLAGFIDADGTLLINKHGLSCCEITTDVYDEPMLREIQNRLGGSVKSRAGSASVRWRLTHRDGMIDLCNRINGHVRLNIRRKQLECVCALLNIHYTPPMNLATDSGYMAGLFDGDGSVTIAVSKTSAARSILPGRFGKITRLCYSRGHHQLSVHIDSSDRNLLESCQTALGIGKIITKAPSLDPAQRRRPNTHYRWYWGRYEHVCAWQAYLRRVKAGRSVKHRRLLMTERYFELKSQKCHIAVENSAMFKRWSQFCHSWFNANLNSG
jgi:hypothetical protein